jgi:hypothetical protein
MPVCAAPASGGKDERDERDDFSMGSPHCQNPTFNGDSMLQPQ